MFLQKNIKRIIYVIVILLATFLLINAISGLWDSMASYETVINNELLVVLPSALKIENVYMPKEKNFKSVSGDSSFKYPDYFELEKEVFENGKIMYHIELTHKNPEIHGFLQVWSIDGPMELFLSNYIITSKKSGLNENRYMIDNYWCIQWDYEVANKTGEKYKACQVFIDRGSKMYVVSLFSPHEIWAKSKCDKIVKSLSHSLRLLK